MSYFGNLVQTNIVSRPCFRGSVANKRPRQLEAIGVDGNRLRSMMRGPSMRGVTPELTGL